MKLSIAKDYIKRRIINVVKGGRLVTPVDIIIKTLHAYNKLPENLIGLDLFGGHGLWNTIEYASLCDYLELWEIDKHIAKSASRFVPDAYVINGDSILAVKKKVLKRKSYNFIFIDNPVGGFYGPGYCEHFDLFPGIYHFFDTTCILIFNVVLDTEGIKELYINDNETYDKWVKRRKDFYDFQEVIKPSLFNLIQSYEDYSKNFGFIVDFVFYVPRDKNIGFLIMSLKESRLV